MSGDSLDREIADTEVRLKALREKRKELRGSEKTIRDREKANRSRRIKPAERQKTIIGLARSGMGLADIAMQLGLALTTIKFYLRCAISAEADDVQSEMIRINSKLPFGLSDKYICGSGS